MKNKDIFNKKGIIMLEGKIICLPEGLSLPQRNPSGCLMI